MKVEAKKAILLFFVLFFAWHILYLVDLALKGLDALLAYSVILAVVICFFILDKQKLSDLGFKKPSLWKRYSLIGLAFAIVIILRWAGLSALMLPTIPKQVFQYGIFSIPYYAFFALVVGLVEETTFRGYILRNLIKIQSDTKAITYSSILFGLYRISLVYIFLFTTSTYWITYWISFTLFTFINGLFLGYFYVNTEQTTIGTIVHHSSYVFIESFVPDTLATSLTIENLLNTSAYIIFFPLLIFIKRKGWLTS